MRHVLLFRDSMGRRVGSGKMRAAFRAGSFLALVGCYGAALYFRGPEREEEGFTEADETHRFLHRALLGSDDDECKDTRTKADPWFAVFGHIFGVMYMFLALAIICDEFFVPALEVIADQLELSMDIAGATLMAAGGSAPELFTSLVGTFEESEVGFSTIVGSAVFNVIFVIGVCALAAPKPLALTWWPLFRDSTYYVISLVTLASFFMFSSKDLIVWWEATILFCMYLGYVFIMYINVDIFRWVLKTFMKKTPEEIEEIVRLQDPEQKLELIDSTGFRAGILDILMKDRPLVDAAGIAVVSRIAGSAVETFDTIDKDKSGTIEKGELAQLLKGVMGKEPSASEVTDVMQQIAPNNKGSISREEFYVWYASSEKGLGEQVKIAFDALDMNKDGNIECKRLPEVLSNLKHKVSNKELHLILAELDKNEDGFLSFEEFEAWYKQSVLWERLRRRSTVMASQAASRSNSEVTDPEVPDGNEDDDDADPLAYPANGGIGSKIMWALSAPLLVVFIYCIPDPQKKGMAWVAFFMSIAWIGVFSYYMVIWAEIIGATLGIPTVVMGLVFLAAGTSVPDLLSSMIVAQHGQGDMAVSSSIGSNIFDVLVGLPFPWILYNIFKNKPVSVVSGETLPLSIGMLMAMLICVIATVALMNWTMYKSMAYAMFAMYAVFLGVSLYTADWGC